MSATGEGANARPPIDLSSWWFTLAVGALVPLFRLSHIVRDYLARKATPDCCLNFIPPLLLVAAAWGAYTPLIFRLGRRFPPSRLQNVLVHLGAVIVLALPIELAWWFFGSPELHKPPPYPLGPYILFKLANSIVPYALILGAGVLRDRYIEHTRYARLLLRLERQLAETELAALRTQLDPELLNSSLAAIEEACRHDEERAERLVVALADFLRITLDQIDRGEVALDREPARRRVLAELRLDADVGRASARPGGLKPALRLEQPMPFTLGWPVAIAILLVSSLFGRAVSETGTTESSLEYAKWAGIGMLLTAPGCFFSVWAAHRLARSRRLGLVIVAVLLLTFAAAFVCEVAFAQVRPGWNELNSVSAMSGFLPAVARSRAVAFHHLLFAVLAFFAIAVRYDEHAREVLALHARVREAQLRTLRAQIRPHFLFNSLNSILGRLGRDAGEAAEMAAGLRRFLRTTFAVEPRDAVALSEELEAVREYLDIERNRAGARMRVEWDVDERAREAHVPALLLQPLVENAVQHGVASVSRAVRIAITAKRIGRSVVLSVEDDGAGSGEAAGRGLGLKTTQGLLAAFYGPDAQFSAGPRAPHGFAVRLVLPYR